jgi:hypothetical protein
LKISTPIPVDNLPRKYLLGIVGNIVNVVWIWKASSSVSGEPAAPNPKYGAIPG